MSDGKTTAILTALGAGDLETAETLMGEPPSMSPLLQLQLGCGYAPKEGWINVDRVARPGVDVVHDLDTTPWPWGESTVDAIEASHLLEHVGSFQAFMNECWRVLKPGAIATITVPHGRSDRAWQDPTHRRALTEASFQYVSKTWRANNGIDYADLVCDFEPVTYGVVYAPYWETRADAAREFALKHYWNVALDLVVYATAKK